MPAHLTPSPEPSSPATTAPGPNLAARAADLGTADGLSARRPLACEEQGEDEHLWPALGITTPATDANAPQRWQILAAYVEAYDDAATALVRTGSEEERAQ